jgi:hypothetical protein
MAHGLVEEMFCESLCIVGCESRDHGDDCLSDERVSVSLEAQNLLGGIEEVLLHKLKER